MLTLTANPLNESLNKTLQWGNHTTRQTTTTKTSSMQTDTTKERDRGIVTKHTHDMDKHNIIHIMYNLIP